MKVASFIVPHTGGTWTAALGLHNALAAHGIAVRFVSCGARGAAAWGDPAVARYRHLADIVAPHETGPRRHAAGLFEFLSTSDFDGVMIDVLSDPVPASLVRHLPQSLLRIMVVHSSTLGTYAVARRVAPHVHATIAISPRIEHDLLGGPGLSDDRIHLIPHGLPPEAFEPPAVERRTDVLSVAFVGRVEDSSKGVFTIPAILRESRVRPMRVSIAGDGPDFAELHERCRGLPMQLGFLGAVAKSTVREILGSHDVLLMPSRFEGFGFSLIEAMAAGCIPVVSRIAGVTDFIVRHDESGWLFRVGDVAAAAEGLDRIGLDTAQRSRLREGARAAASRFRLDAMGDAYAGLLNRLMRAQPALPPPSPMASWRLPMSRLDALRARLPRPVKGTLRAWRERLRAW